MAVEQKQNRALSNSFTRKLDPEGIHVVTFTMPHMNWEGTSGMRCHIFCKVKDSDEPVEVWLDMDHDLYNSLQEVEHNGN